MDMNNKVVLVTGGTGSFGHKFVEIALKKYNPKKLIIFSRDEYKQFHMKNKFQDKRLRFFLGDVRDPDRLHRALNGVDIVVHAAALKQVPALEYNPFEAVKTNVIGAENIINLSLDNKVEKVIALSSDKAVNPINLYGATKLCADKLFIAANAYTGEARTQFSVVRYGNVFNSRGSVVPLFRQQSKSGTVTITDERMTRFWITLKQGVELVLKGFSAMKGGEIFVPKIPSMKITDLAEAVAPGCKRKIIGIRPGEKLHETLIPEDEAHITHETDDMYIIMTQFQTWGEDKFYKGIKTVKPGFKFTSDNNKDWLTVKELKELLKKEESDEE